MTDINKAFFYPDPLVLSQAPVHARAVLAGYPDLGNSTFNQSVTEGVALNTAVNNQSASTTRSLRSATRRAPRSSNNYINSLMAMGSSNLDDRSPLCHDW